MQNKLLQLNISGVITKGVSSGIESTLQKIQDDIEQEKLKISNVNIIYFKIRIQKKFRKFFHLMLLHLSLK